MTLVAGKQISTVVAAIIANIETTFTLGKILRKDNSIFDKKSSTMLAVNSVNVC